MNPTAPPSAEPGDEPPVPCDACRSALASVSRDSVAFLLLDQFTLPVVGCRDHLERFRAICAHIDSVRADTELTVETMRTVADRVGTEDATAV